MADMKDKVKELMKKVNSPFSSSSKFKGQGRVLGSSSSSSSSSSSGPSSSILTRPNQTLDSNPSRPLGNSTDSKPVLQNRLEIRSNSGANSKPEDGFDRFSSLITSGKRNLNGYSLKVFECPVCGQGYGSEEEVSEHVESCLNSSEANVTVGVSELEVGENRELRSEWESCVSAYISGKPSEGSTEVILRLLRNIEKEPENAKFRKIRMGNPKIKEAIVDVTGGIELLECVGFQLKEEGGEMWAVMDIPTEKQITLIRNAISSLGPPKVESLPPATPKKMNNPVESKKIDRQTRVFFSVPEIVAAKMQLPDSFYNLSREELKREADMRRKKIEESQLLIPKSYREKQTKAAKKRYSKSLIRIQFPDGVVLQGVFSPSEPTSALYEFAWSALKASCLEFELLHPVAIKRRVIPHFPAPGERSTTLEEEDLVPSALLKFKPIETDSIVFTGLCNELLEISEPLVTDTAIAP